ncbi:MAG: Ig domain-containing protein [Phycisphaerae bacterium]
MNRLRWMACLVCASLPACGGRLIVDPAPLVIATDSLPNELVDESYRAELTTDDNVSATWRIVSGSLPPGLSLNAQTGVVAGTALTAGTFEFMVEAQENALVSRRGRKGFSITIIERLQVNPNLEFARIDEPYSDSFTVSGGIAPYTFELIGLPGGLDIDEMTGTVSGTPRVANEGLQIEVTVTDSGDPQQTAIARGLFVVLPRAVSVATLSLPDGRVRRTYVEQLEAVDGTAPYTWAVIAGVLPDGVRLNLDTGVISGVPSRVQTAMFTVKVTDSGVPPTSGTKEFTMRIDP